MANDEKFEKLWSDFMTKLKGKMLNESKKQKLTYSLICLVLDDVRLTWGMEYEQAGRWLSEYSGQYPKKGALIRQILLDDMMFKEIPVKKGSEHLDILIPMAGAVAGLGISSFCNASRITKVVSTVAPAVVLYPSVRSANSNLQLEKEKKMIDEYLNQLEKYKVSVLRLLEDTK